MSSVLSTPLRLRDVTLRNRMVVSPMQMYAGRDGMAGEWHASHLGRFALGGFAAVFTECLAIEPDGRNTYSDLGAWDDGQIAGLAAIAARIEALGAVPAAQIWHSGPKGSRRHPDRGFGALDAADAANGERPWTTVGASAVPVVPSHPLPRALEPAEIARYVGLYGAAARRCVEAGFRMIEVHAAHGYLIHAFYSPVTNRRTDAYGGSFENRTRFAREVATTVRAAIGPGLPLSFRLSCIDGVDGGWSVDDSVALARDLRTAGVDLIDCSSRGVGHHLLTELPDPPGYQVPYAAAVRSGAGVATMAVGLILDGMQAETILSGGQADLVCIGRQALQEPNWALNALNAVDGEAAWELWPASFGRSLRSRAGRLNAAR